MCSEYETGQNSDNYLTNGSSSLQILSLVKISQVQGAKGSLSCKGINEVNEMKHNFGRYFHEERGTPESSKKLGVKSLL